MILEKIKRILFLSLGFICLGFAYIGLITPGIPYSPFIVASSYCFAKSSKRLHNWIYNHKLFGPFLINWETKKIFPQKMKYMMLLMMSLSLVIIFFTTENILLFFGILAMMVLVAVWAWSFPGSIQEYKIMKLHGKKIKWHGF